MNHVAIFLYYSKMGRVETGAVTVSTSYMGKIDNVFLHYYYNANNSFVSQPIGCIFDPTLPKGSVVVDGRQYNHIEQITDLLSL